MADTADDNSSAGNTVIIIVNDDTGNISVDQETLQLLTSQENTTLSVVRVNEAAGDNSTDVNITVEEDFNPGSSSILQGNEEDLMETDQEIAQVNGNAKTGLKISEQVLETTDPLLALDQEEIEKIEHALQAEAGAFFNNILPPEAGLDDLLDPELTGEPDDTEAVASISLDHCYSAVHGSTINNARNVDSAMSSEIDSSDSVSTGRGGGGSRRQPSPKRRSQRQIDRQEMEQLKKIRAENEELLKKEKEEMNQTQQVSPPKKEAEEDPEETLFVPVPQIVAPEVTPPAPAQPLSRLAAIRQKLQQDILSVDPVKAKVHTLPLNQPVKTPLSKPQPLAKTPQTIPAKTPAVTTQTKSPAVVEVKSPQAARAPLSPQKSHSPQKAIDSDSQSPLSRVSSSGGVTRPRRENRQPPKHLREAFNQLEFEGIEKLVKKTSVAKSVSSPDEQTTMFDSSVNEEIPDDPLETSPKKIDQSKEDEDDGDDDLDDDDDDDDPEGEGSESEENEDDPDRLWCVCREPHNNRFMICCDKCEEWFHGKCVGITRGMGRELELKKLEWICPKCVRQEYADTQEPFIHLQDIESPEKPNPAAEEKTAIVKPVEKPVNPRNAEHAKTAKENAKLKAQMTQRRARVSSSGSGTAEEATTVARRCIGAGCKSDARVNSVYCSEACIASHVRDSLIAMSKEKTKQAQLQEPPSPSTPPTPLGASKWKESVEFGQLMSQPTPPLASKSKAINQMKKSVSSEGIAKPANLADDTPVPVLERKTGKILSGSSAPKVSNLEQWLKDNSTFEVIKPATLPTNKPRLSLLSTTPTVPSMLNAKSTTPTSLTSQASSPSSSASLPRIKTDNNSSKKSIESSSASKLNLIRKRSIETFKDEETPKKAVQSDPESTRARSKSSLKETLWNRCKDATDLEIDEQTVEQVATEVEEALYRLFNKDVGTKYKNKYRTLIFNIKDPKNLGLFRKIIEKQITPGQLVKMSTEELASKELAEWREQEAKHQLDIIQKTELELMNMSNKYLVKTHKGEEIIEEAGKELDEGESATSTTTVVPAPLLEALQDTTSKHKSHLFDLNCQICTNKIKEEDVEKDKSSTSSSNTSSRKKNDKSSRQSSHHSESSSKRSEKDRRDRDRKKRDHDKERSRHRPSRSKERHHRHRSDREKERAKERKKEDDKKEDAKKEEVKKEQVKKEDVKKDEIKKEDVKIDEIKKEDKVPTPESVKQDPEIGEVLTVKQDNGASIDESEALPVASADDMVVDVQPVQEKKKEEEEEPSSKQEPTSTVSIKTPEQQSSPPESGPVVWKGIINSVETGKVNVQALDMSGTSDLADLEMPSSLDVVGRIRPEMVWDYVNQTRRAGTRDIVVFKFTPASDSDRKHYSSFLSHMYKHNRFAVVGAVSKLIKDFYVVPLPKDSPIPLALVSLSSGTKSLDENRTSSLLLGVVVRARKKRPVDQASNGGASVPHKAAKLAKMSAKISSPSNASSSSPSLNYIPTSRATSKMPNKSDQANLASKAEPISSSSKSQADDAPYSPGQLLGEEEEAIPVIGDDELLKQQAMLEELNRQIEAQKQELASMSAEVAATTPPEMMIPGLGEPVIPGLGEPSTSSTAAWTSVDTRVTPSTDPPFDHSAKPAPASINNLNISNLQEIISTIQKKEMEMKMTSKSSEDRPLPIELFSPHDVDMRIAGPIPVQPIAPVQPVVPIGVVPVVTPAPEKKKPSLLNQLTDEQLLAKAMEMEMEQAGIPTAPMAGQQFFPPPRGAIPYPPMGPGMPPGPPMMGHPRPFRSPPFMGARSSFNSPPSQGGNFRTRPNKKKR